MAFESHSLPAAADICHHLSKEAPAAPSSVKPAFNEESPELLPGQPPARQRDPPSAISTQQVRLLRFCKQEKTQIESCQCCDKIKTLGVGGLGWVTAIEDVLIWNMTWQQRMWNLNVKLLKTSKPLISILSQLKVMSVCLRSISFSIWWCFLVQDDLKVPCLRSLFLPGSNYGNKQWKLETKQQTDCTWKQCVACTKICAWKCLCRPVSGSSASCLSTRCPADGCCLLGDSACSSGSASTPVSSATRKKIWKWKERA